MEKGLTLIFVLCLMLSFLNSFLLLVWVAQTLRYGYQPTQFEWWSQDTLVAEWGNETGKGWKAILGALRRRLPQWGVQLASSYPFWEVRKLEHLFTSSHQSWVEACSRGCVAILPCSGQSWLDSGGQRKPPGKESQVVCQEMVSVQRIRVKLAFISTAYI